MEEPPPPYVSFDEFKFYYDTTEKVTNWRLETNRWGYSICTATLIGIAAIVKWGASSADLAWLAMVAVITVCVIASLFCELWIVQIRHYERLNDAKFHVLSEMAPRIDFDVTRPGTIVSYQPLEREWRHFQERENAEAGTRRRLMKLRPWQVEYFIPRAFQIIFLCILVGMATVSLTSAIL